MGNRDRVSAEIATAPPRLGGALANNGTEKTTMADHYIINDSMLEILANDIDRAVRAAIATWSERQATQDPDKPSYSEKKKLREAAIKIVEYLSKAKDEVEKARSEADSAQSSAEDAKDAADKAEDYVSTAKSEAEDAYDSASSASSHADTAESNIGAATEVLDSIAEILAE
jgi:chromosome segregation ATPase